MHTNNELLRYVVQGTHVARVEELCHKSQPGQLDHCIYQCHDCACLTIVTSDGPDYTWADRYVPTTDLDEHDCACHLMW